MLPHIVQGGNCMFQPWRSFCLRSTFLAMVFTSITQETEMLILAIWIIEGQYIYQHQKILEQCLNIHRVIQITGRDFHLTMRALMPQIW
ncbi:hypothetical protein A0U94_12060 [Gluconobacter albidus]|nr:hypothetical protein A0U94_12060 [Gluconobacter albidus]